jgi:hypothetical protein
MDLEETEARNDCAGEDQQNVTDRIQNARVQRMRVETSALWYGLQLWRLVSYLVCYLRRSVAGRMRPHVACTLTWESPFSASAIHCPALSNNEEELWKFYGMVCYSSLCVWNWCRILIGFCTEGPTLRPLFQKGSWHVFANHWSVVWLCENSSI